MNGFSASLRSLISSSDEFQANVDARQDSLTFPCTSSFSQLPLIFTSSLGFQIQEHIHQTSLLYRRIPVGEKIKWVFAEVIAITGTPFRMNFPYIQICSRIRLRNFRIIQQSIQATIQSYFDRCQEASKLGRTVLSMLTDLKIHVHK